MNVALIGCGYWGRNLARNFAQLGALSLSLGKIRREGNILWSFAPHDIAIILSLIGQMPFEVSACGGAYLQANIPDVTVINLLFDNGVRAHIFVSWLHPFKEQRLVVIGSRNMASFDDVNKKLILYDQRVEVNNGGTPTPIKGDGEDVAYGTSEPLRQNARPFSMLSPLEPDRSRMGPAVSASS